jgi:glycosyltransferase involved in cell wall biosynthesis
MLLMEAVRRHAGEFDVLHFHNDYWPFSLFSRQRTPFLTTMHGRLDLAELQATFDRFPDMPLVSISDAQRRTLPQSRFIGTVLHGLPADLLTPSSATPSYLAFLGRMSPEKGPERAIRIARACGIKLLMAAKVDKADQAYFETVIRPMLDGPGVEIVGEINESQKADFLGGAHALLAPIDWPEPFGLVMIEAMACGTPVIAMNCGAVPEIVEDGVSGFIVNDEAEAVAAVGRLGELSRGTIRACFEAKFTARRMAEEYLALYHTLAGEDRLVVRGVNQDPPPKDASVLAIP